MQFVRALQTALHWILLLIEAGTLTWLVALLMALLGWAAWGVAYLCRPVPRRTAAADAGGTTPDSRRQEHRHIRAQRG